MLSKLYSVTIEGIEAQICEVEVDVSQSGFDKPMIVGLPDAAVKESSERVRSAIVNSGFTYPDTKTLVNLAPADIKKEGPSFDLPIAAGILAATGIVELPKLSQYAMVGELALSGEIRRVRGVLPITLEMRKKGKKGILVPEDNAEEAAVQ